MSEFQYSEELCPRNSSRCRRANSNPHNPVSRSFSPLFSCLVKCAIHFGIRTRKPDTCTTRGFQKTIYLFCRSFLDGSDGISHISSVDIDLFSVKNVHTLNPIVGKVYICGRYQNKKYHPSNAPRRCGCSPESDMRQQFDHSQSQMYRVRRIFR